MAASYDSIADANLPRVAECFLYFFPPSARTDPGSHTAHEFISQLYFDKSVTDKTHNQALDNGKGRRTTSNDGDFIFRRGGKQLMPALSNDAQGYFGEFHVGLRIS